MKCLLQGLAEAQAISLGDAPGAVADSMLEAVEPVESLAQGGVIDFVARAVDTDADGSVWPVKPPKCDKYKLAPSRTVSAPSSPRMTMADGVK